VADGIARPGQLFGEAGGTRLVGAGTCAEYNWAHGYCREATTPLAPTSLYGSAKAACGLALDAYARETAMSAAWARLFFLFGPFDSPDRLVPSLVRRIGAGQPARCTAGSHIRDFLHVDDAAAALAGLLQSSVQGAVNIASGVPIRVGDVAHHVAARMERLDLLTIEDGPARDAFVCADVTRLRDEVRWKPSKDTFDRLDETIRWWRSPEAETTVGERLEQS
jgi:nucleoside-diphosphate-sugar epimerase